MTQEKQKKTILEFRQDALDNFTLTDRTDQLIQVTSPRSWILLATLGSLILVAVIWGFLGSITIWVEGQGILLPEKGSIYKAEATTGPAQILEIKVKPQDKVRKGDIVAVLENPNLDKEVQVTLAYVERLKTQYNQQKETANIESSDRKKTLEKQNQATQKIIDTEKENLEETSKLVQTRKELLDKKMLTSQLYQQVLNQYYDLKNQIEKSQEQLLQNQLDANNCIDQWNERLKVLDRKVNEEQLKLDARRDKAKLSKHVSSPADGIVISIAKTSGEVVQEGDTLVNIAKSGKE